MRPHVVSDQTRNLAALVVGGLFIGELALALGGVSLLGALLQDNLQVYHGRIWQLVTSIIVAPPAAVGVFDAALNAVSLVILDGFTSPVFEPGQYYGVFLACGVAGNLLSLLNGPGEVSFGASGGIFGLVAGVVAYDYAVHREVSPTLVGWFLFVFIYSSFLLPGVDWLAHLGGAVLGLLLGYLIGSNRRLF